MLHAPRCAPSRALLSICRAALAAASCTLPAAAIGATPPSRYFDLSHWKLTLPVDAAGGTRGVASELQPAQLDGYASQWFEASGNAGVEFWAPVNGATTPDSDYPRSELREMLDPGNDNVNWTLSDQSSLLAKCKVMQVPDSTGKVVIGQIHGFQANPLIKLVYHYSTGGKTGSVYALVDPTPTSNGSSTTIPLASGIALGQAFTYEIRAHGSTLKLRLNDDAWVSYRIDPHWAGVGMYFKAGDYVQASGSSGSDGARVVFYHIVATHPDNGLAVTTESLDDAKSNSWYDQTLVHGGGIGGIKWKVANGVLPAGLTLGSNGVLSGTPLPVPANATYYFTVLATDQAGDTAARNFALMVAAP